MTHGSNDGRIEGPQAIRREKKYGFLCPSEVVDRGEHTGG